MTSEQLYYNFNLLLNKNSSLKNVAETRPNFVLTYNRESLYWLNDFVKNRSSTQEIHDINGLLKADEKLNLNYTGENYYEYDLPYNYFHFADSKSDSTKGKCSSIVYNYLQKPKELHTVLDNEQPSFEFEESVCNITEKKLRVYINDYKINNTYLSYYLKPEKIDLEGYIDLDTGLPSKTIDSSLDDLYQFQILDRVVLEVFRRFENTNAINISQNRQK